MITAFALGKPTTEGLQYSFLLQVNISCDWQATAMAMNKIVCKKQNSFGGIFLAARWLLKINFILFGSKLHDLPNEKPVGGWL